MTQVVACVPTIGRSPYLRDLVFTLTRGADVTTRLYVNSDDVPVQISKLAADYVDTVELVHMPGDSIYVEWNHAADWANDLDAYLMCVTDDVVINASIPGELALALDVREHHGLISADVRHPHTHFYPHDVIETSHQAGNRYLFATWCFIADPLKWQDVDPRYQIWYGDDDLLWKVHHAGWKTGYLQGVGVTHHTSTTLNQCAWVPQAAAEDGELWASTH